MKVYVLSKCGSGSSESYSHWAEALGAYSTRAIADAALAAVVAAAQAAGEKPGAYYGPSFVISEVALDAASPAVDTPREMCAGCGNQVVPSTHIGCGCNDGKEQSVVNF